MTIGSFKSPDDPNAEKLRENFKFLVGELYKNAAQKRGDVNVFVPAPSNTLIRVPQA